MKKFEQFANIISTEGGTIIILSFLFLTCFAAYLLNFDVTIKEFAMLLLGALLGILTRRSKKEDFIALNIEKYDKTTNSGNTYTD